MNISERKKHYLDNIEFFREGYREEEEYLNSLVEEHASEEEINKAVQESVDELLNVTPYYDDMLCNEEIDGIAISEYLEEIRNQDREYMLAIAIENGSVKDYTIAEGKCRFMSSAGDEKILKLIKDNPGAHFCFYHNHPRLISAMPSTIDTYNFSGARLPEVLGVEVYDWGVVTAHDFYSFRQKDEFSKEYTTQIKYNHG